MLSKLILQLFNKKKWERVCQKDHTVLFVELFCEKMFLLGMKKSIRLFTSFKAKSLKIMKI